MFSKEWKKKENNKAESTFCAIVKKSELFAVFFKYTTPPDLKKVEFALLEVLVP